MRRICVFCGSNDGATGEYRDAARRLGEVLVSRGLGLVYGGAKVGTMGEIADAVLRSGGEVIGVIPEPLVAKEVAHLEVTDLRVVSSMHERKALMAELSDGFIALPGGFGTLDELFEIVTWAQLGLHDKPCGLLNVGGFFDHLIAHLDRAVARGFLRSRHRDLVLVDEEAERLLDRFRRHPRGFTGTWVRSKEI